jgi:hypothetical protein
LINFLEFLACVVGIMLSIEEDDPAAGYCYLSASNNTSAMGWLRKSNFVSDGDHAAHLGLAREFTSELLRRALMNYSQWFAGEGNWVADLLSRDLVSSDHKITTIINSHFPSQVPKSFKVSPLPAKISSFLSYWVQLQTLPRGSPAKRTAKPTPPGDGGSKQTSSKPMAKATPTSAPWTDPKPTAPSVPLPTLFGCAITANPQKDMLNWLQVHAVPPSTVWLRPSSQQTSPTPDSTLTEKLRSFLFRQFKGYKNNDPGEQCQQCLPFSLLKKMLERPVAHLSIFIVFHQLMLLGFFFAIRSCENVKVSGERRTHPIRKRNMVFRKGCRILPHSLPRLHLADTIAITFEYQKRDERNDTMSKARASTQSASDSTPFARRRPWQCISTVYRCTPSCCSVAGPATLSSATSGRKLSLLVAVSRPR